MKSYPITETDCFHHGSICNLYMIDCKPRIVVKMLRNTYHNNKTIIDRFNLEQQILEILESEKTPELVDIDIQSDSPHFAYKHIDGISLDNIISTPAVTNLEPVKVIRQLLTILSHCYDAGIVHSDISPDNILIDKQGELYLIDFGSADLLTNTHPDTSTWISKYRYCSPEQAQGRCWTYQSDLYQCGLIFYELLTGRSLNDGKGKETLAIAARPHDLDLQSIPEKYHSILSRMLETEPENRCTSPRETLISLNTI